MSAETLLSAARRVARCCRIDEAHGGLMSIETLKALSILDIQLERARQAVLAAEAAEREALAQPEMQS
jgi:hypothetical protein